MQLYMFVRIRILIGAGDRGGPREHNRQGVVEDGVANIKHPVMLVELRVDARGPRIGNVSQIKRLTCMPRLCRCPHPQDAWR